MLHSTYYHKDTYEDPKTSAVFENLMLLPDNVFWHILKQSCFSSSSLPNNAGQLLSVEFWPHWDSTGTRNRYYVEPDVFVRFEELDVIIEAKYGDVKGQGEDQWEDEIIAYHNEYGNETPFAFIAIGGNMSATEETKKVKEESVIIHKCNWLSILILITKYKTELEKISVPDMANSATMRLLDNIILAFNINGVYNIDWFNTMAQKHTIINPSSIDNLQSFYKW